MVNKSLLFIVIINFLLTLFLIYYMKQNQQTAIQSNNWQKDEVLNYKSSDETIELSKKLEQANEKIATLVFQSHNLEEDWQSSQKLIKELENKVILLAALNNENVWIKRYGNDTNQLLYLKEDWTLSRIPTYVKLNEQLKVFLPK